MFGEGGMTHEEKETDIMNGLDETSARLMNELLRATHGSLTGLLRFITTLGNGGAVFLLVAIVLIIPRASRAQGLRVVLALLLGVLLTDVLLKNLVARPRPFLEIGSLYHEWWRAAGALPAGGHAFPSGHTTAAAAFSCSLLMSSRKKSALLLLMIPLLMGATRIYFMVHYASDVLSALLVGMIAAGLVHLGHVLLMLKKELSDCATSFSHERDS